MSTVRIDRGLECYHRFLGFDGFPDLFRYSDEMVPLTNFTMIVTMGMNSYGSPHKEIPQWTGRDI